MNQNQTQSKPADSEQGSGKGLSVQRLVLRKAWLAMTVLWGCLWLVPMMICRLGFAICYGMANLSISEGINAWEWTA